MNLNNCVLYTVFFAVVLNLVLPYVLKPFATEEEKKPPNGAASLSYKGQFMHMMVDHSEDTLLTSVFIIVIIGLSGYLGYKVNPMKYFK